jgi:RimJ/RimL family protein N-acetyltransferase
LHAHDELELATVTAIVSPKNTASIGLLRKLGLVFEKTIRMPGEDEDVGLYSINLKDQENHGIFHE